MISIDQILKYSEEHSRVIILILLGIITTGSVFGALWINSLNNIISEKDKISDQCLEPVINFSAVFSAS
jgi:hypothetical protein